MRIKFVLTIVAILGFSTLFANSIFSFYGMPVETYGIDAYGLGAGETGFSDLFRTNLSYTNPSIMATSSKITVSTSSTFGFVWYKDNNSTFRSDTQYFPYFNLSIPLKSHKLGFSFNSLLSGNFVTRQDGTITDNSVDYDYTEIHKIDANVFKTSLLYAFKNKYVNFGLSGDIYMGHRIKYWKIDFKDDYFNDATYEHEEDLKNFGFTVGLSKKINDFSFGTFYKSSSSLYGSVYNRYSFVPGEDTLSTKENNLLQIPEMYGAGITYNRNVYKISFETIYENYQKYDDNSQNTLKISVGLTYDPILGYGSWINNVPFRLGYTYKTLPYKVNNSTVSEKKLTAGFTIPLHHGEKINFAISLYRRGDINKNNMEDTGLSFNIGISAFDIFSKRHRRIKPREIPEKEF